MTTDEAQASTDAAVDALWEEEMGFLAELVRRPSLRGHTNEAQEFVAQAMTEADLDVVRVDIDPKRLAHFPGYTPVDWPYDGLFNVVGIERGAGGGRSLCLNGHIDIVPAEPLELWTRDPWGAQVENGRMYGRGVADMKSGVAALLFATRAVRASGARLRGDVFLQSVFDEECSGNGTLACIAAGYGGEAAIVVEPTAQALVTAHPGVFWCEVEVTGRGAHASRASTAVNAIDAAYALVEALRVLEKKWNAPEVTHSAFAAAPHPINFNLATIEAGDWPSKVPQTCRVGLRLAFQPGVSAAQAEREIRAWIARAAAEDERLQVAPPKVRFGGLRSEAAVYDLDTDIARTLAAAHQAEFGTSIGMAPLTGVIDNRMFELYYGIPNCCYGATGGDYHGSDEWVDLESLRQVTKVLALTLIDWCGTQ